MTPGARGPAGAPLGDTVAAGPRSRRPRPPFRLALDVLAIALLAAALVGYGYAVLHLGAPGPILVLVSVLLLAWAFNRVAGRLLGCLVLVALLVPGCAARQSIPVAATADLVTTEMVLAQGGHEANPMLRSTPVRVSAKVVLGLVLVWACERLEKDGHHGWAKAAQWGATGLWAGAAAWNLDQMTTTERRASP